MRLLRQSKSERLPVYAGMAGSFAGCVVGLFACVALVQCDVGPQGPRLLPYQISMSPGPWLAVVTFGSMVMGGLVGCFASSRIWRYFHR